MALWLFLMSLASLINAQKRWGGNNLTYQKRVTQDVVPMWVTLGFIWRLQNVSCQSPVTNVTNHYHYYICLTVSRLRQNYSSSHTLQIQIIRFSAHQRGCWGPFLYGRPRGIMDTDQITEHNGSVCTMAQKIACLSAEKKWFSGKLNVQWFWSWWWQNSLQFSELSSLFRVCASKAGSN